jgi:hypothetical protein
MKEVSEKCCMLLDSGRYKSEGIGNSGFGKQKHGIDAENGMFRHRTIATLWSGQRIWPRTEGNMGNL